MEKITEPAENDTSSTVITEDNLEDNLLEEVSQNFLMEDISETIPQSLGISSENDQICSVVDSKFSFVQRLFVILQVLRKTYHICFTQIREKLRYINALISLVKSALISIPRLSQLIFEYRNLVTEISIFIALMIYGPGYFLGRASIMFLGTVISLAGLLLWCSPFYATIHYWFVRALLFFISAIRLKFSQVFSQTQSEISENIG